MQKNKPQINFVGILYDCKDIAVRGAQYNIKYLTGGLELGVRVVEATCSNLPAGWDFYRLFGMQYFNAGSTVCSRAFSRNFLCLLIGSNNNAADFLKYFNEENFSLKKTKITSKFLQGIQFKNLTKLGKAAWLPATSLSSSGHVPPEVSQYLRGSDTMVQETDAILPLRNEQAALVAQASGFVMLHACDDNNPGYPDHFVKQINLFGLYKAYEQAMQEATCKVANVLNHKSVNPEKTCSRLVEMQETLAEFDARYYFESPVEPSRHELTKCAAFFAKFSTAGAQHNDLINQIERLGNLSRSELRAREERRAKKHDHKLQRIAVLFTFVAALLAGMQLVSHSPEQWFAVLEQWGDVVAGIIGSDLSNILN